MNAELSNEQEYEAIIDPESVELKEMLALVCVVGDVTLADNTGVVGTTVSTFQLALKGELTVPTEFTPRTENV